MYVVVVWPSVRLKCWFQALYSHFDGVGSNPTTSSSYFYSTPQFSYNSCVLVTVSVSNHPLSCGSVAEWSKALVLSTIHFDGVGSNPTTTSFLLQSLVHSCL